MRWLTAVSILVLASAASAQDFIELTPTHNSVTVRYGKPDLAYETSCTATLRDSGGTALDTSVTSNASARRVSTFTGLSAATNYKLGVACGASYLGRDNIPFATTVTPAGGDLTVPIGLKPSPLLATAARVTVDYGTTTAVSDGSVQNTSCSTGCTVNLSIPAGVRYYRWRWQTAGDAVLATSAVQPISVGGGQSVLFPGSQSLAILDSFERPEYADAGLFKTSGEAIKLSKSEPVGYVVKLANASDMPTFSGFTRLYKLVDMNLTSPSFVGGRTGIFYDAMVPLLSANLAGTTYIYAEYDGNATPGTYALSVSQSGETVSVNATVVNNVLAQSGINMWVQAGNGDPMKGHWMGVSHGSPANEQLGLPYSQALINHRMSPYGNYAAPPGIKANGELEYGFTLGFDNMVRAFTPNFYNMYKWGWTGTYDAQYAALNLTLTNHPEQTAWLYAYDEPKDADWATLTTALAYMRTHAPLAKRMVTSHIDRTNAWPEYPEIMCPTVDNFDHGTHPGESAYTTAGVELWLYTACMEHGCGNYRTGTHYDTAIGPLGALAGTPGLVTDHPSSYVYAFILMPMKYTTVKGLLYYNTMEDYGKYSASGGSVDLWGFDGNFNFGGNGDGELFYPIRVGLYGSATDQVGISMRVKKIRDAMYLLDYVKAAGATAVANCGGGSLITDTYTWEKNAEPYRTFRSCLITALGY